MLDDIVSRLSPMSLGSFAGDLAPREERARLQIDRRESDTEIPAGGGETLSVLQKRRREDRGRDRGKYRVLHKYREEIAGRFSRLKLILGSAINTSPHFDESLTRDTDLVANMNITSQRLVI